jgi:hypothetical protein
VTINAFLSIAAGTTRDLISEYTLSRQQADTEIACLPSIVGADIELYRNTTNSTTGGTLVASTTGSVLYRVNNVYPYYNYYSRIFLNNSQSVSNVVNTLEPLGSIFAGRLAAGFDGDGGPAIQAAVEGPEGIAFNSSKTMLYIADATRRIRQVNMSTNAITTIIGDGTTEDGTDTTNISNGVAGLSVGVAKALRLAYSEPFLLMVHGNSLIRAYNTGASTASLAGVSIQSGHIRTITSIASSALYGIALDANGDIFVANANSRIHKVSKVNATQTTVAGTGTNGHNGDSRSATTAQLNIPTSCDIDNSRNVLVITDRSNRIVRAVNLNATGSVNYAGVTIPAGFIERVAGKVGDGRASGNPLGDGGPARDAQLDGTNSMWTSNVDPLGNIYIGDGNFCRRVDAVTGIITGVTGYTESLINDIPAYQRRSAATMQSAFGADNSIYVASFGNSVVNRIY